MTPECCSRNSRKHATLCDMRGVGNVGALISRTLLVKGLEYDHVIIADVGNHTKINDLYVALSRARKSITILGRSDTLQLQPSPNGR